MEVSGERNSCDTVETKSDCIRETSISRRIARAIKYVPAIRNTTITPMPSNRYRWLAGNPAPGGLGAPLTRSEEHTSELQSLRHLVCRLLLEKKTPTTSRQPLPRHRAARGRQPRIAPSH